MLYSYIFTCYILVRMIDAADPEKLIFQKALLLAFDQKKTLLLKQNHIKGLIGLLRLRKRLIKLMVFTAFSCHFKGET